MPMAELAYDGRSLSIRLMQADEIPALYLPLRYDILYRELGWVAGDIQGPAGLVDNYDPVSKSFGIFTAQGGLMAAGRLIEADRETRLPSARLLAQQGRDCRFEPPVAELSRILVARPYRAIGLFPVLLFSGVLLACREGVRSLIITEKDDERYAGFMARHGFRRQADGFSFSDGQLNPREPAATYLLHMPDECREAIATATAAKRAALLLKFADGAWQSARPAGSREADGHTLAETSTDWPP